MNKIPDSFTLTTGELEKAAKTIDDFFIGTKQLLEKKYDISEPFEIEIRSANFSYMDNHITDDCITYMTYMGSVVACVFETRTMFNNVRYDFLRNLGSIEDIRK